jgi:hypothetical protein
MWSESEAAVSGQHAPRPGKFNAAGEFFDPDGLRLHPVQEAATPEEAQRLVRAGALVVYETCGCGGWVGSCAPQWLREAPLAALRQGPMPSFTGRNGTPTWIDTWANEEHTVVFAHGDVSWGPTLR